MKLYYVKEFYNNFDEERVAESEFVYSTFEEAKNHKLEYGRNFEITEIDTDTMKVKLVFTIYESENLNEEKNNEYFTKLAESFMGKTVEDILGYCYNSLSYDFSDDNNYLYLDIYEEDNYTYISLCIGGYDITQGFDVRTDLNKIKNLKPIGYRIDNY